MRCRKVSSPWIKCALLDDCLRFLPGPLRFARLCRQMLCGSPRLRKPSSTFPRMTAWPVSRILDAVQGSRITYGPVRRGKNHDQTSSHMVTEGPGRGRPLHLLWCIARDRTQFESGLAVGVPHDTGRDWRAKPLSSLSPCSQRPAYWSACERAPVRPTLAFLTADRLASPTSTAYYREGSRQETCLAGPSLEVRANGRRKDA
jgi:hypothetical protein